MPKKHTYNSFYGPDHKSLKYQQKLSEKDKDIKDTILSPVSEIARLTSRSSSGVVAYIKGFASPLQGAD